VLAPPDTVPYWVTEPQYSDPVDDTPAQFIVGGLKPATTYTFWVTGRSATTRDSDVGFNSVSVTTADFVRRYVDPSGSDAAEGDSPERAWKTLARGTSLLQCGQVLLVSGGTYDEDSIRLSQSCSAEKRAVVLARDGEQVILRSPNPNSVIISGRFVVLDGIEITSKQNQDYDVVVMGHHNAMLNLDVHPSAIPSSGAGIYITGNSNLLYGSYVHDYGSPDDRQNPGGNGGFVLTLQGSGARDNVIWSNHLTRGGHDVSLCKDSCSRNRWLNNIMDGGWGMGWEAVGNADENLFEGNTVGHTGKLVTFYKPGIEVSGNRNTVRRNIIANFSRVAIEVSAFLGTSAGNRIYNNTVVGQGTCLFMSANGGDRAYEGNVFANNLCYKATSPATEIYPGNTSCSFLNNAFVNVGPNGRLLRGASVIIWNHSAAGDFQYPRPVAFADQTYPPFAGNAALEVLPDVVSEHQWNFRLKSTSKLVGAGVTVNDSIWGAVARPVDVGAFGIASTSVAPRR
jgi:hypothetical protein